MERFTDRFFSKKPKKAVVHSFILILPFLLMISTARASRILLASASKSQATSFTQWTEELYRFALKHLMANISAMGTTPGAVITSPSRENPNYFYVWIKVGALATQVLLDELEKSVPSKNLNMIRLDLSDYVSFSRLNQITPNRSGGLGEPKFQVDGKTLEGDISRPQNDGPALRVISLIRYAFDLLKEGASDNFIRAKLYDGKHPSRSIIKVDLEYIATQWKKPSFDLWEQTYGMHFYTQLIQRRALTEGRRIAERMKDLRAKEFYQSQVDLLGPELDKYWDSKRKIIHASHADGGRLDMSVILASIHANYLPTHETFSPVDERILSTAQALKNAFENYYEINQHITSPEWLAPAMGRFEGDRNPWILTTLGFAEYHFKVALNWLKKKEIRVTAINHAFIQGLLDHDIPKEISITIENPLFDLIQKAVIEEGDLFLKRFQFHATKDGTFYEQIHHRTGQQEGAHDFTWSYASFLTAINARNAATALAAARK